MRTYSKRAKTQQMIALSTRDHTSTSWKSQAQAKRKSSERSVKFFNDAQELQEALLGTSRKIHKSKKAKVFYTFSEKYQGIEKLLSKVSLDIKSSPNDPEYALISRLAQTRSQKEAESRKVSEQNETSV